MCPICTSTIFTHVFVFGRVQTQEPFGMAFIECMACGTLTIRSKSGGPTEFVKPVTGIKGAMNGTKFDEQSWGLHMLTCCIITIWSCFQYKSSCLLVVASPQFVGSPIIYIIGITILTEYIRYHLSLKTSWSNHIGIIITTMQMYHYHDHLLYVHTYIWDLN